MQIGWLLVESNKKANDKNWRVKLLGARLKRHGLAEGWSPRLPQVCAAGNRDPDRQKGVVPREGSAQSSHNFCMQW